MAKERLGTPRARLFVALDIPDDVRDALVSWQRRRSTDPALRAMRPETLHLTLAFLGYHPEKQIEEIAGRRSSATAARRQLELRAEPVGVPRGRHPRLFAIEADSPEAVALQARGVGLARGSGLLRAREAPVLASSDGRARQARKARLEAAGRGSKRRRGRFRRVERTFDAVRLSLYRSHLRPQGAEYEALAELELKP